MKEPKADQRAMGQLGQQPPLQLEPRTSAAAWGPSVLACSPFPMEFCKSHLPQHPLSHEERDGGYRTCASHRGYLSPLAEQLDQRCSPRSKGLFDSIHKVFCHATQRIFFCCPNNPVIIYPVPEDGFPFCLLLLHSVSSLITHQSAPRCAGCKSPAPKVSSPIHQVRIYIPPTTRC